MGSERSWFAPKEATDREAARPAVEREIGTMPPAIRFRDDPRAVKERSVGTLPAKPETWVPGRSG